jgi:threonylcarbamoyladenosine tRNA methylthiotransferase MtaB
MTVEVITLGCRLNAYESEVIRARVAEAGLSNIVIVNTCAVTGEAVRQSRQAIRRLRRSNPEAEIIVTGCAAQIDPERFAAMPEVDRVLGNQEKLTASSYGPDLLAGAPRVLVNDIAGATETAAEFISGFAGRTRAILQVQNGCDHRCTFCIIPFGRGPSRSVGLGAVVEEAKCLCAAGYREIVLSGVDLTAYGADLPGSPTLGKLVAALLRHVPQLCRLRLSSIDPAEVDDLLFQLIEQEERLMPHFHLSVQSGDDLILKRMKRRHSRADVIRFCDRVRRMRPETAFGADLIAGFPTETAEHFNNTLRIIDEAGLTYLHVFPFSPRRGTPAAKMPQLDVAVVKDRARTLRAKGAAALAARFASIAGTEQEILVEEPGSGRTPCFAPVQIATEAASGEVVRCQIERSDGRILYGRVLNPAQLGMPQAVA